MPLRLWRELSPGTRFMAASAFFFSVMSVFVKLAGARLPASHVVLGRGVVTLVLSSWALWRGGVSPRGVDRLRLALRGFFGFLALNCYFTSLKQLPLADATVLQYSSPVFTALFAALTLGETMRPAEVACVAASFVGVLLVGRPAFLFGAAGNVAAGPLAVALCGSLCSAVAYVLVRRLRRTDRPEVVVFFFPLVAVPLSIPPVIAEATWPAPLDWLLLLGVGVFTQAGQIAMTRALHAEAAGRAASMSFLQIVFAYGWGLLLFHERPNLLGTVGSVIVAIGTIALARLGSRSGTPPASSSTPVPPSTPATPSTLASPSTPAPPPPSEPPSTATPLPPPPAPPLAPSWGSCWPAWLRYKGRMVSSSGKAMRASGVSYGARVGRPWQLRSSRALLLVAPWFLGGCGALLGISEIDRSDETPNAGAGGGSAGDAPGPQGQGGTGNGGTGGRPMMPAGMGGRPPGGGTGGGGTGGAPVSGAAGEAASGGTGGNTGGTGGNTGGTAGVTGGTGGTGGAAFCKGDLNEPNDTDANATLLGGGSGEMSPCQAPKTIGGVAGLDSEDWFYFSGRRGSCQQNPGPYAELNGLVLAELCYFLLPYDKFEASCPAGFERSDEVEGYTGCCKLNQGQVLYDGDDAEILIRVRPAPDTTGCMAYELSYSY